MKKSKIITLIFVLITLAIIIFVILKNGNNTEAELAKCIGEKSVLYVATGCVACDYQEKLFGENYEYINTIDCAVDSEKCSDITGTPTWIINNEKVVGVQAIEKLKQLTEC